MLFQQSDTPRLFALPPGVDFTESFVAGLLKRLQNPSYDLASVEIYVNTRRMSRQLSSAFSAHGSCLLPRIKLVTDPADDPVIAPARPAVSDLRRLLDMTQLVQKFLITEPDLAFDSALFPLCQSLDELICEMHAEAVPFNLLKELDVSDESGHWARSLRFFEIAAEYSQSISDGLNPQARQRAAVLNLCAQWSANPPQHPVIIAGTTASRGTTALLARAIAHLPQGAVVFPGVDQHMPTAAWDQLSDPLRGADHPQYRLAHFAAQLGLDPENLPLWTDRIEVNTPRNRLISLALRPAPVTDAWLSEGPALNDLTKATENVTLVEAPSPRIEAEAIALRLREAAEKGEFAALISPDRQLTRQVTTALERWNIRPDDSAGLPMHHTPPGRALCQIGEILAHGIDAERLLRLLKHPLAEGPGGRGVHLRWVRELELHLRRHGPPYPTPTSMESWAKKNEGAKAWSRWASRFLEAPSQDERWPLALFVQRHTDLANEFSGGPQGPLWDGDAGAACRQIISNIAQHADASAPLTARDYHSLFVSELQKNEYRSPQQPHPKIVIWGTLEARVQSADMVILAGLNEAVWPASPKADPWLNRKMRAELGLLIPERQIGLAAHDFQQAAAAKTVWFSRSQRDDETETVPSRWLNRLTNLLDGLEQGRPCLAEMRRRGTRWINIAQALDRPVETSNPACRPSPRVPSALRPTSLRITDIAQLLRDPYAIYARDILRLRALDPINMTADARLRGIAIHEVMEKFVDQIDPSDPFAAQKLLTLAEQVLEKACPWPMVRLLWLSQLARIASDFCAAETDRRAGVLHTHAEISGELKIGPIDLRGRADRIDILSDGRAALYDYKTGAPPTKNQQLAFEKQLLIEAAMLSSGAFEKIDARGVADARYLQIGSKFAEVPAPLEQEPPDKILAELGEFLTHWSSPQRGYTARIAAQSSAFGGTYDQLARYGEWDESFAPVPEDLL